ncbi:MAG: tetratricopeptide repeat protein [Bacteroidales bacterium]|jgi:tetratricopeptide (TPR) repeat protein|nr:tetratricopeptide repeat protein [Bacteroidales bacterium]
MKRRSIFLLLVVFTTMSAVAFATARVSTVVAQEEVSAKKAKKEKAVTIDNAQKLYSSKKIPAAVEAARAAMLNPKTEMNVSTYLTLARLYVAASGTLYAKRFPNAEDTAFVVLQKALSLDSSETNRFFVDPEIEKLSVALYERGGSEYEDSNYSRAADFYEKAYNVIRLLDQTDTGALFNVALCAEKAGDSERAQKNYELLANVNYRNLIVYQHLALLYEKADRKDDASKMLDISIKMFPDDSIAYLIAANENLVMDNYNKVIEIGKASEAKFPVFPLMYVVMGASYQNAGDMDNAEVNYHKAYEQAPDDYEPNFRIGAFYVEKGNKVKTAAENLPLDAMEQYRAEKARSKDILGRAIPHLEKALALSPDNIAVIRTLRDLYNFMGDVEKATEFTSKINTLEGQ